MSKRTVSDSMGTLEIPADALYGAQTERARINFPVSSLKIPEPFIEALGLIKGACAEVNLSLGLLDTELAKPIIEAAQAIADGQYSDQFPLDVFQTGSGTSTNMNANEVIATLASKNSGKTIHPNDHVNMGQSSNDVIPTAIHVSGALLAQYKLIPALQHLSHTLKEKAKSLHHVTKTGRTHLMDAMPVRFDQELGGYAQQIDYGIARVQSALPRLLELAQGGTAVGTGVNADPRFGKAVAAKLAEKTGCPFVAKPNYFEALSAQDAAVEMSGQLRVIAVSLMKIANDLRWMNSGPLAGLGEIQLPALQPGSSIMPGKVNPVIPEAVCMVCAQIMGNDLTISVAGQSGNFQLNVMLPVIAYNLIQSLELLTNVSVLLADKAIQGFIVNETQIERALDRNPILVTALNAVIGYEKGAQIAKQAYKEGRSVKDVTRENTTLTAEQIDEYLDPRKMTE
ncbi:MAG: class II fumarate hydratase [Gammaproteobacteria bacterium]